MRVLSWDIKEIRWGSFSHYEIVMECEMLPDGSKFQIRKVVLSDDEALDFVKDVNYFINAGNNAIENSS